MKHLSRKFRTQRASSHDFVGDLLSDKDRLIEFIDGATGKEGDTLEDRLLSIFLYLRQKKLNVEWYRIPTLRWFLDRYIHNCPFIPSDLREKEISSRAVRPNPKQFTVEWASKFGAVETFYIEPKKLIQTIEILPDVKSTFLRQNLHSHSYFFTKYTEWHVTRIFQNKLNAKNIVDIGAAYDGFARTMLAFAPEAHVTMVDLAFAQGIKKSSSQISEYGADAASMKEIKSNSVDLVCMHNAFEHFAGDSDIECLEEVSRVLAPGGVALITPFFFAQKHSITLSPAASFLFDRTSYYADLARTEIDHLDARLDFNTRIVSPFARRYDMNTCVNRIIQASECLQVKLKACQFEEGSMSEQVHLPGHTDILIDPRIYELSHFCFLELTKL